MSSLAVVHAPVDVEREDDVKVLIWRFDSLSDAGYPPHVAGAIAAKFDIDLHRAVDLIKRGSTVELALEILL